MWRVRKGKIGLEASPWPTSVGIQPPGLVYSPYPAEYVKEVGQKCPLFFLNNTLAEAPTSSYI